MEYRDTLSIIADRLRDAVSKGRTLEQVRADRITRDCDGRYGAASGPASASAFLGTAYRSVSRQKPGR